MPHQTTWTRILGYRVVAAAIEDALRPLLVTQSAHVPTRASRQIALDGKTSRGSSPPDAKTNVHLVSTYQVERGVPLVQVKVATKANELVVAPDLLAHLDLVGVVVTGDAMFAQRNLSTQIVEAGGDYCWIVKANQPRLYHDVRLLFGPQPEEVPGCSPIPDDFVSTTSVEKAHGRLDERVVRTSNLLADYQDWPYLAQAFQVVRTSTCGRRSRREVRYPTCQHTVYVQSVYYRGCVDTGRSKTDCTIGGVSRCAKMRA